MEETINVRTVARYFETAILYGTKEIEAACLNWLKVNLLSHLPEHPEYLRNISINLMEKLIKSPDLFVMQTEFSVYVLLRYAIRINFGTSFVKICCVLFQKLFQFTLIVFGCIPI